MRKHLKVIALGLIAALVVLPAGFVGAQSAVIIDKSGIGQVKRSGVNQKALVELLQALRNRVFTVGGTTFGTTPAKAKTVNTLQYMINGVSYSKAGTDDLCTLSGTAQTNAQTAYWRLEVDSSGNCTATQGKIVTSGSGIASVPTRSTTKATFAYIKIVSYTFTPGTTTLNNAAVTFVDGDPDLGADALTIN